MFIYYGFTPRSFVSRLSHLYTFDQFLELEFVTWKNICTKVKHVLFLSCFWVWIQVEKFEIRLNSFDTKKKPLVLCVFFLKGNYNADGVEKGFVYIDVLFGRDCECCYMCFLVGFYLQYNRRHSNDELMILKVRTSLTARSMASEAETWRSCSQSHFVATRIHGQDSTSCWRIRDRY